MVMVMQNSLAVIAATVSIVHIMAIVDMMYAYDVGVPICTCCAGSVVQCDLGAPVKMAGSIIAIPT